MEIGGEEPQRHCTYQNSTAKWKGGDPDAHKEFSREKEHTGSYAGATRGYI